MAWTTFANPRGSFASSQAETSRFARNAFGGKVLEKRKTWGMGLVALAHLSLLTIAVLGFSNASLQNLGILSGIILCCALLMPTLRRIQSPKTEEVDEFEAAVREARTIIAQQAAASTPTYKLSSPELSKAFFQNTATPGEAWTDLASRISHELRTPLNAVIGFSDLMERELHGPLGSPQYNEYTRHILDSGKALLKSAEDTLAMTSALARLDSKASDETVKFNDVVQVAWAFLADEAKARGITFTNKTADADLSIVTDFTTQRQVLINMFRDVLHASLDNGHITISAEHVGSEIRIEIAAENISKALPCEDSLDLCLARALLDIQGAPLKVLHRPLGTRRLQTTLLAAAQHELF